VISDVLSDATYWINDYLDRCPDAYPPDGTLTARIKACVAEMDAIVAILDTPPSRQRPRPPAQVSTSVGSRVRQWFLRRVSRG
jgi:hypothetical protein